MILSVAWDGYMKVSDYAQLKMTHSMSEMIRGFEWVRKRQMSDRER